MVECVSPEEILKSIMQQGGDSSFRRDLESTRMAADARDETLNS